jgi:rhamnosyltransferase
MSVESGSNPMNPPSVCGIIVTYHPTAEMVRKFAEVLAQVAELVVVDNGSSAEEVQALREASTAIGFHLLHNPENLGIATALNQGVTWAQGRNHNWVFLLDQDSFVTDGLVRSLITTWESHPERELVGTICPLYRDPISGETAKTRPAADGAPVYTLTSGSLLPLWIFQQIGMFADEYFIDYVDVEFSLRMRAKGYRILEARDAILNHSVGSPTERQLLGLFRYHLSNHSYVRRYYMYRNRLVTIRKYFKRFPRWALYDFYVLNKDFLKIAIAETDRTRKVHAMLRGAIHSFTGRMGRMPV